MSKSKEPINTIDEIDPPPAYTPAATDTDTTQETQTHHELPRINPRPSAGAPISTTVTRDQVIAHLKFLAVLSDLRDTIASTPDLFGIPDADRGLFGAQTNEAQIRVKEKRWAVYTARAVERYEAWWNSCLRQNRATVRRLYSPDYGDVAKIKGVMEWDVEMLPPIDVLMVLHSHMLNPRGFLEDTIRYNQQGLWSSGFPWTVVNACIDNSTLTYAVSSSAVTYFEEKTSHKWDNLSDDDAKTLVCPRCMKEVTVPWTTGQITPPLDEAYSTCHGYADRQFSARCPGCKFKIDHERLKVAKFRRDVEALLHRQYPMPGTLYNLYGVPTPAVHDDRRGSASTFPNRFIKATAFELVRYTDPQNDNGGCRTVRALRDKLEDKLNDRGTMKRTHANLSTFSVMTLHPEEKVSFRRMMGHYWDNLGPFALDLVGAVIRQGTFVTKMDELDWLHSPTLNLTVTRFIKKYEAFFSIMAENPQHMAVPTLDVDLVWHTHQLGAARYYLYSAYQTSQRNRREIYIDHDDKVDENRLSDGFEWTSKMYKTLTGGELYSECLCWYCEAVRTPDSRTGGLFSSSSSSATDNRADQVRDRLEEHRDETITHPDKNPHISAHNAVRPQQSNSGAAGLRRLRQQDPREVKMLRLRSAYQTAERRAAKRRGRGRPLSGFSPGNPVYPMAWGIPMYVEPYAPYMCDPGMHEDAYVANPGCMALHSGAHGNCVAGTCGGAVAAGRCGGRAGGACGGGCAGGDGGAGGGACGGGGGGSGGGSSGGCGGGGGGGA